MTFLKRIRTPFWSLALLVIMFTHSPYAYAGGKVKNPKPIQPENTCAIEGEVVGLVLAQDPRWGSTPSAFKKTIMKVNILVEKAVVHDRLNPNTPPVCAAVRSGRVVQFKICSPYIPQKGYKITAIATAPTGELDHGCIFDIAVKPENGVEPSKIQTLPTAPNMSENTENGNENDQQ